VKCDRERVCVNVSCAPEQRGERETGNVAAVHTLGNDEDTEIVVTTKVGTDMRISMKVRMTRLKLHAMAVLTSNISSSIAMWDIEMES
jgi:hypothetical protein